MAVVHLPVVKIVGGYSSRITFTDVQDSQRKKTKSDREREREREREDKEVPRQSSKSSFQKRKGLPFFFKTI